MQPQRHWKDRAMSGSQVITDAWDVTKAILARLAEWVLFGCMVMNIIEILPGVVLSPLVSNLVLSVQAVTLDVAGFGLASMADHARDNGDLAAARTGKRTGWFLIGLMIVTLLLVSVGLLWPQTQTFTATAEKGLILARVIMTVVYSHVVHSLRRSTHTLQAIPAVSTLDYTEIARHLKAFLPQPAPAPQIDYQELVQQLAPLMPTPHVDYEAIRAHLEATCKATILREITASGVGASLRPRSQSHLLALEPPVRATRQNHLVEPEPLTRATRQSHLVESEPVAGATVESQSEPVAGTTEERLQAAYQVLAAEGGRVSGRALAARARCNRAVATEWLQRRQRGAEVEPEPLAGATLASQSEPVEVSA